MRRELMNVLVVGLVGLLASGAALAQGTGWPSLDGASGGGSARDDVALVVAIGTYDELPPIAGAVENGQAWVRWLAKARGIQADRVSLLVDKLGTRARILAAASELAKKTRPGGTFWLVFIGHGVTNASKEGVLVGVKASQEEFDLFSQSVTQKELVAAATGRQSATVAVIDACFSGQTSEGETLLANRGATVLRDRTQRIGGASTTWLFAAEDDEFAGPLPGAASPRPAFSYLVLGALQGWADREAEGNQDGKVTAAEAVAYARFAMDALAPGRQSPNLSGAAGAVLATKASESGPDLLEMKLASSGAAPGGGVVVTPGSAVTIDLAAERAREASRLAGEKRASAQREALRKQMLRDWRTLSEALAMKAVSDATKESQLRSFLSAYATLSSEAEVGAAGTALARLTASKTPPAGFVQLEAGRFTMGSPASEAGRDDDEVAHEVTLTRPFFLQSTEVTQGEWTRSMGRNPSRFPGCGDRCPVEGVNWFEAVSYANRRSQAEGLSECYRMSGCTGTLGGGCSDWSKGWCEGDYRCNTAEPVAGCSGYRLPTEAEWEYAARAGTATATYNGNLTIVGARNSLELDAIAWYGGNSAASFSGAFSCSHLPERQYSHSTCGPQPVGTRRANAWGLYDMIGNVWEWTQDWHGSYSGGAERDPTGASSGSNRVFRGGGWSYVAHGARASFRFGGAPGDRGFDLGFRLARSAP